jgi:hypothetical protein
MTTRQWGKWGPTPHKDKIHRSGDPSGTLLNKTHAAQRHKLKQLKETNLTMRICMLSWLEVFQDKWEHNLCENFHTNIHNRRKMNTIQMTISDGWISNMWCIHMMQWLSLQKEWNSYTYNMVLEIHLCYIKEASHKKATGCMIPFMWNIQSKQILRDRFVATRGSGVNWKETTTGVRKMF